LTSELGKASHFLLFDRSGSYLNKNRKLQRQREFEHGTLSTSPSTHRDLAGIAGAIMDPSWLVKNP
jgi:hypothetical protein